MSSRKPLSYVPPYLDIEALAEHISVCPATVENWTAQGILPAPRRIGGKRLWKWSEVEATLDRPPEPESLIEKIRRGTEEAISGKKRT